MILQSLVLGFLLMCGKLFGMDVAAGGIGDLRPPALSVFELCEEAREVANEKHALNLRILSNCVKLGRNTSKRRSGRLQSSQDAEAEIDPVVIYMSNAFDKAYKAKIDLIKEVEDTASSLEEARIRLTTELKVIDDSLSKQILGLKRGPDGVVRGPSPS